MGQGRYPDDYLHDPYVQKPLDRVFADMDAYTHEIAPSTDEEDHALDFWVLLPPLHFEGRRVKGVVLSQGIDRLVRLLPDLKERFHLIGNSMSHSISWSREADALFALYDNPEREAWFRRTYPERAHQLLLPMQDQDFTNEYLMAPQPRLPRDLDLVCIANLYEIKNLPQIARGLKAYREKYPDQPIKLTLITGRDLGPESRLLPEEQEQVRQLWAILGHLPDYIDLVGRLSYPEIADHLSRAKAFILGSLVEGKNRALYEAMACDTPAIVFKAFNQFLRGRETILPAQAGLLAPWEPEGLADTIHAALFGGHAFAPRKHYLQRHAKRRSFNRVLDAFPYYRKVIPHYAPDRAYENPWLDEAVVDACRVGLHDFLYGRHEVLSRPIGIDAIRKVDAYYRYVFMTPSR